MITKFFQLLKKSKVLPWVGITPFVIFPLIMLYDGEISLGLGFLAFFGSMWGGVFLGELIAKKITNLLGTSKGLSEHVVAAFGIFGFLFLPVLVGIIANAYLHTEIEMHSLGLHFLWACVGGGVAFCVGPSKSE